jgi:carbamoyl-phosphate synthase large subunit
VVVKFARWAFEKFKGAEGQAGHPDAGRRRSHEHRQNYKEALQKAIRSLEIGRYGLGFAKDFQ